MLGQTPLGSYFGTGTPRLLCWYRHISTPMLGLILPGFYFGTDIPRLYVGTEHLWEAHGMQCCQETHQRPREQGGTPRKSKGFRPGKCTWENAAAFAYDVYKGFQMKDQTSCGDQSRSCSQQSPVPAADGPVRAVWRQPSTDPVDCRSAHG